MNVLYSSPMPYLILLGAAVVVGLLVLVFRRYRKPIDKDENEPRS